MRSTMLRVLVTLLMTANLGACKKAEQPANEAVFRHDFRTVFSTGLGVFADQNVPVSFVSKEKGVIRSGSVEVTQARLRQLIPNRFEPVVEKLGQQGGRYVLEVKITKVSETETRVRAEAMVVVKIAEADSPVGGQDVPSNDTLEREFLEALQKKLLRP